MKFKRILFMEWLEKLNIGDRLRGVYLQCACCGEKFVGGREDTDYCSEACRQKAYRGRNETL